jgi:hypothetical protein
VTLSTEIVETDVGTVFSATSTAQTVRVTQIITSTLISRTRTVDSATFTVSTGSTTYQGITYVTELTSTSPTVNAKLKRTDSSNTDPTITIPTYAPSCSDLNAYTFACGCLGISPYSVFVTTTLPASTTSITLPVTETSESTITDQTTSIILVSSTTSSTLTTLYGATATSTRKTTSSLYSSTTVTISTSVSVTTSYYPLTTKGAYQGSVGYVTAVSDTWALEVEVSPLYVQVSKTNEGSGIVVQYWAVEHIPPGYETGLELALFDQNSQVLMNGNLVTLIDASIDDGLFLYGTSEYAAASSQYGGNISPLYCSAGPPPSDYLSCQPWNGRSVFYVSTQDYTIHYADPSTAPSYYQEIFLFMDYVLS